VAGFLQIERHRAAHDAKADESDFHVLPPKGSPQRHEDTKSAHP
jgi:hypothetical protein